MTKIVLYEQGFIELNAPGGAVDRAVAKAAGRVRDNAKRYAPVRSGSLRNSIHTERKPFSLFRVTYRVGTDKRYASWQEEGVRGPIYPRRAKVLRFKPKGATGFVFARMTKGVPATHFLAKALAELRASDFFK